MTAFRPLPDFNTVLERSLDAPSEALHQEIAKAQQEEALPSVQPKVEKVISSIGQIERALRELDQKCSDLGLAEEFLPQELCSRVHLQEHMVLFAQSVERRGFHQLDEIEKAKASSPSNQVPVAHAVDLPLAHSPDRFYVEDQTSLTGDLNWEAMRSLPRLGRGKELPSAYLERACVVDRYEEVMHQIMGSEESHGLRSHSMNLRITKSNMLKSREMYLSSLCLDLGFMEGEEYSQKYKYLRYPRERIELLRQFDVEDETCFEELKVFGLSMIEEAKKSLRMEMVEVYMQLRLFIEYSQYIDSHYYNFEKLPDQDFENYKAHLKIEIANRLGLSEYFWGSMRELSYEGLGELQSKLIQYKDLLPQELTIEVDRSAKDLVKRLHENGQIEVFAQKRGKKQIKLKDLSTFDDYSEIDFQADPKERFHFEPSKKKSTDQVRLEITEFLREQTFNLVEVQSVEENAFFQKSKFSLYFEVQVELLKQPCRVGHYNLQQLEEGIGSTENVLLQTGSKIYSGLAAFGASNTLFRTSGGAKTLSGVGFQAYLDRINNLEKEVDLILQDLPIGVPEDARLDQKLSAIADFLLHHPSFIDQRIELEGMGLQQGLEVELKDQVTPSDTIREFFREYARHCLKGKLEEINQRLSAAYLEKEEATQPAEKAAALQKIESIKKELESLKRKTAEFGLQIYQLYLLIYNRADENSFINLCMQAQTALLKGEMDYESELKYNETMEQLQLQSTLFAPSLFLELNQFLTSLRVNHVIASLSAGRELKTKGEDAKAEVLIIEEQYEDLKSRSEKSFARVRKLEESGCSQTRIEKAKKVFKQKFQDPAKELLERSVTQLAKHRFNKKKIKDLSQRILRSQDFDARMIEEREVELLAELGEVSNPYLDMWIQAVKMQREILSQVITKFEGLCDGVHLSPNPSRSSSFSEEEQRAYNAVEESIEALDQNLDYFNLGLASQMIPSPFLVPSLFGVGRGHFFNVFSEEQIADILKYAYHECEAKLTHSYQDEIDALAHQAERTIIELTSEQLQELVRTQEAAREQIEEIESEYSDLHRELQLLQARPQRKTELLELKGNIQAFIDLKKKRATLRTKRDLIHQTLNNTEIVLNEDAGIILNRSFRKIDAEYMQIHEEYLRELELLAHKGKALGLWETFISENALEKVQSEIDRCFDTLDLLKERLVEVEERRALILQEFGGREEEISNLERTIRETGAQIESTEEEDAQRYHELILAIRQKALQTSFEMLGLSFSSEAFKEHPYFEFEAQDA